MLIFSFRKKISSVKVLTFERKISKHLFRNRISKLTSVWKGHYGGYKWLCISVDSDLMSRRNHWQLVSHTKRKRCIWRTRKKVTPQSIIGIMGTQNHPNDGQIRWHKSFATNTTFKHSHPSSVHRLCQCAQNSYVPASRWIGWSFYDTVNKCKASLPCGLSCEHWVVPTDWMPFDTCHICTVSLHCEFCCA